MLKRKGGSNRKRGGGRGGKVVLESELKTARTKKKIQKKESLSLTLEASHNRRGGGLTEREQGGHNKSGPDQT